MGAYLEKAQFLEWFKPVVGFLIKLAPYFLTSLTLMLLFIIMPNTKVKLGPALISGIVTGTILQVLLWFYIDLQWGITKLSAIYGSFAMIPLFIILLQMSWTCVLLGAELTFANQNVSQYEFETEALAISNYHKRALTLMIMHLIVRNFEIGEHPLGSEKISRLLKIPVRLSRDILTELVNVGLVSAVHEQEQKERLFQPALDINKLTIHFILSKLDKKGTEQRTVVRNKEYEKIIGTLERFDRLSSKSDSNILIKDL